MDIKVLASSSKGNCYRISDGRTPLLLECGIKFKDIQKGLNFKLSDIEGCLITHEHGDHAKSVKDIIKAGIDVYTSLGTTETLNISGHRVNQVKAKEQFQIGTWSILPFETHHDAAEPLGFLLSSVTGEKVLFATDTYYIKYKFEGLTHIMIECNYSKDILKENVEVGLIDKSLKNRLIKSHFSLDHVKEFLKANDLSKVKQIYLLHLSEGNSDADRFKREVKEITGKLVCIAGS